MKLRQSTEIATTASEVWPYLADPLMQAEWNPKIVSIDRKASGLLRTGETFQMIYRMSGKAHMSRVEITEARFVERLVLVHHISRKSTEQRVEESYEITPLENGVRIVQTLDLRQSGIPFPLRLLIGFIHRVGRDTEEPYLERLKQLAETRLP